MDNRIWHFIRLCFINSSGKRAEYLKKRHIFGTIGNNCTIMDRKIPLYPNLIHLGNNVHIASQVTFVTHDAIHLLLNNLQEVNNCRENKYRFPENIGCIEIGDNCFIGSKAVILPNVKIGNNVIVGASSLVNKDIPSNSVVAGVPARVIGKFSDFLEKRKNINIYPENLRPCNRQISKELSDYMWNSFCNNRREV